MTSQPTQQEKMENLETHVRTCKTRGPYSSSFSSFASIFASIFAILFVSIFSSLFASALANNKINLSARFIAVAKQLCASFITVAKQLCASFIAVAKQLCASFIAAAKQLRSMFQCQEMCYMLQQDHQMMIQLMSLLPVKNKQEKEEIRLSVCYLRLQPW
jgi:hypothetical protein